MLNKQDFVKDDTYSINFYFIKYDVYLSLFITKKSNTVEKTNHIIIVQLLSKNRKII